MVKFKKEWLVWIVGILFVMSMMPGVGNKASNQQAIVATEYSCNQDSDCPSCVGGGLVEYNASDDGFFGELSAGNCVSNKCELSDACIIWDCGATQSECSSVKQTLLDNTVGKLQDNPAIFLWIIGGVIVFLML